MSCPYTKICGGCPLRNTSLEEYRKQKHEHFLRLMAKIDQPQIAFGEPIFIADGQRRRAEFTFNMTKSGLNFGFNAPQSHIIADIKECPLLLPQINTLISKVRDFLEKLCQIEIHAKTKKKKFAKSKTIIQGKIMLTFADNGIDILLKTDETLEYEHRILISDFVAQSEQIIRFCVQYPFVSSETIIEKTKPYVDISAHRAYIPAGAFLQATKQSETAMIELVLKYLGSTQGKIADLFCGIGTFSYPVAQNIKNKITAVDADENLLQSFEQSVNAQHIPNINICKKNLFKYPLSADELKNFKAVIFDPPRAGAAEQIREISKLKNDEKMQKIIAISCNPHTFINDANNLLNCGYTLKEITLVDQFTYSTHMELVALFEI